MKRPIQLSDHFTYRKLLQFVFPSIVMMIFTSIYGVVDGLFVSNYAGKTAFAAINLVMPFIMVLGGIGFMIGTESLSTIHVMNEFRSGAAVWLDLQGVKVQAGAEISANYGGYVKSEPGGQ